MTLHDPIVAQPTTIPTSGISMATTNPLKLEGHANPTCKMCAMHLRPESWNIPLYRTINFDVVPSKGSFLLGWLMIVPKSHVLSFAELPSHWESELNDLISQVTNVQKIKFGAPTLFEHGASVPGSTFGCGIDHAHIHLVPLPNELKLSKIAQAVLGEEFKPIPVQPGKAYLKIREPDSPEWVTITPSREIPRQFFRQLIWEAVGRPSHSYDYDVSPCENMAVRTIEIMTNY